MYQIFTYLHVLSTAAALLGGLAAFLLGPKGGKTHLKAGKYYVYFYTGVLLTAYVLLTIKFKLFFFALTLFGTYLVLAGRYYARKEGQKVRPNTGIISLLFLTTLVYFWDVVFVCYNLPSIGPGWATVRLSFAAIAAGTLVLVLFGKLNRRLLHAIHLLLSFVPLVNGLLARLTPTDYVWASWLVGYVVLVPALIFWVKRSKYGIYIAS